MKSSSQRRWFHLTSLDSHLGSFCASPFVAYPVPLRSATARRCSGPGRGIEPRLVARQLGQRPLATDELLARERREVAFKQAPIDKLTHEVAILRRLKYAVASEKFCAGISAEQKSLLEQTLDSDIMQLTAELEQAANDKPDDKEK